MPSWPGGLGSPHPGRQRTVCLFTEKVRVKLSIERWMGWGSASICGFHRGMLESNPKALVWCLLDKLSVLQINILTGIYEWEEGKKNQLPPTVWQIPRQRSSPFRPPPFFGMSYLFVFGGSHFSSSPLPGLEVREETNAGNSLGDWLLLPHGCGDWVSPSSLPPWAGGSAN